MTSKERTAYIRFMFNRDNAGNCEECPANIDLAGNGRYACGQYRCWVDVHCAQFEEEEVNCYND